MLVARGIAKRFGAVRALDAVDLRLRAGEIHCLMGENGAGKSTLIKCLTGVERADGGVVELDGNPLVVTSVRDAEAHGISTVYQEVSLIPHLSVADNIALGREPRNRVGLIDRRALRSRAVAAVARLGVDLDVDRELVSCPLALQQLVAIARALDVDARVLILDEPTSSLDRDEVEDLFTTLRRLKEQGLAILFVTHFLDEVFALSDRITVLRDGRLVEEMSTAETSREQLIRAMVGRDLEEPRSSAASLPEADEAPEARLLVARKLARRHAVESVDLAVGRGESVGLAGLLGSGRTEVARLVCGADAPTAGTLEVDGRRPHLRSPRDAIALGIVLSPEDRKGEGLILELSVRENIELAVQARRGVALRGRGSARVEELIEKLGIRCPSPETPVAHLSGGNQQKVLLARWLATRPRLLVLDEPTRGIDVAAKAEILAEIDRMRAEGMAILFISSELEEVARVCDRVVVLRDRRSVAELSGEGLSGEGLSAARILQAMAGSA